MKPGDSVRYSREWCRNTGNIMGPIPFLRGTILSLGEPVRPDGPCIARIRWTDGTESKALTSNLEHTRGPA
jgi:hypothetical protein